MAKPPRKNLTAEQRRAIKVINAVIKSMSKKQDAKFLQEHGNINNNQGNCLVYQNTQKLAMEL